MTARKTRLIHCVVPTFGTGEQTLRIRIVTAHHLVGVFSYAPAQNDRPQNIAIDSGPYGRAWVSDAPIPDILRAVFHYAPGDKTPRNDNRPTVTNEVEFAVTWAGTVSRQVIEPLHAFAAHYALRHSAITKTKDNTQFQTAYLLAPDQVVGFQRVMVRLSVRRPWMQVAMTGPWPPFSFPEIWPSDHTGETVA
jgi:hypothetical protein